MHILINNAGVISGDSGLGRMNLEQWQDIISNDLGSIFNVTRAAIDSMRATGFWADRPEYLFHRRAEKTIRAGQLFDSQSGHAWLHKSPGAGSG